MLSTEALSVHEASATFNVDYLLACILQVLFLLQGGYAYLSSDSPDVMSKMTWGRWDAILMGELSFGPEMVT